MPYAANVYRVLIASPADAATIRLTAREVIHDWNSQNCSWRAAILEPVLWETHVAPQLGSRPQRLLNLRLVYPSDVVVAFFFKGVGSPTGRYISGTVEEIEESLREGKRVLLYFIGGALGPSGSNLNGIGDLDRLKAEYQSKGIIGECNSEAQFRDAFSRHLTITMNELLSAPPQVSSPMHTKYKFSWIAAHQESNDGELPPPKLWMEDMLLGRQSGTPISPDMMVRYASAQKWESLSPSQKAQWRQLLLWLGIQPADYEDKMRRLWPKRVHRPAPTWRESRR